MGINFISLNFFLLINFQIAEGLVKNTTDLGMIVFLNSLFNFLQICYTYFLVKKFVLIFGSSLIILTLKILFTRFIFKISIKWSLVSEIILLLLCNLISYTNEASSKIELVLKSRKKKSSKKPKSQVNIETNVRYKLICDNFKNPLIAFNMDGDINYLNSLMNIIFKRFIDKETEENVFFNDQQEENPTIFDLKNDILKSSKKINYFEIFFKNRLENYKFDTNKEHKLDFSKNLIKEDSQKITYKPFIPIIFENLFYINEKLSKSSPRLFEYLINLKNNNQYKSQREEIKHSSFNLQEFIKLTTASNLYPNQTLNQSSKYNLKNTILTDGLLINNDLNSYLKINDNSELNILKLEEKVESTNYNFKSMKTFKSLKTLKTINSRQTQFITGNNDVTINNLIDKLRTDQVEGISEQFYIGKTNLPFFITKSNNNLKLKETKEFYIYCTFISENQEIILSLQDISQELNKEIKETSNLCRSLYLSKFSHELKNPICNLLEIVESLEKNLNLQDKEIKFNLKNYTREAYQKYRFNSSSSDTSDEDIELKCKDLFSRSYFKNSNCLLERISKKIRNLKSIAETIILIFKDFSFYSNLSCKDEVKEDHTTSIIAPSNERILNYSKEIIMPKSPTKRLSNNNITSGRSHLISSYRKICNFKEIISEIVNIFINKSEIDNKQKNLLINFSLEKNLPDSIDMDKEKFRSMIFNIFYHMYMVALSGKIEVCIKIINPRPLEANTQKKLNFEIILNGTSNFSINNRLEILKCKEDDIDHFSNFNSLKENYLESNGNHCEKEIKMKNSLLDSTRKKSQNGLAEKFNLLSILKIGNSEKRNTFVDNFNRNFQFVLANIYANHLGLILNYEQSNIIAKFSFTYDLKQYELNSILNKADNGKIFSSSSSKFKIQNHPLKMKRLDIPENLIEGSQESIKSSTTSKLNHLFINNNSSRCKSNHNPSERTLKINDAMVFNYPYFIKENEENKKMFLCSRGSPLRNIDRRNTDKLVINQGNIIINHKYYIDKSSLFQKNGHHLANIAQPINKKSFESNNDLKVSSNSIFEQRSKKRNNTVQNSKLDDTCINTFVHKNKYIEKEDFSIINDTDKIRVILCDDENLIRKTIQRFLHSISKQHPRVKFEIDQSENGFECLKKIYENHKEGKYYDILIIDETMPFMKGSQLINLLRNLISENNFKDILIVSFTSYDSPDKIDYIYEQGADHVLSKPIKYEDFKNFFIEEIIKNINKSLVSDVK
jgi:CheY-like chemotaxis protein